MRNEKEVRKRYIKKKIDFWKSMGPSIDPWSRNSMGLTIDHCNRKSMGLSGNT